MENAFAKARGLAELSSTTQEIPSLKQAKNLTIAELYRNYRIRKVHASHLFESAKKRAKAVYDAFQPNIEAQGSPQELKDFWFRIVSCLKESCDFVNRLKPRCKKEAQGYLMKVANWALNKMPNDYKAADLFDLCGTAGKLKDSFIDEVGKMLQSNNLVFKWGQDKNKLIELISKPVLRYLESFRNTSQDLKLLPEDFFPKIFDIFNLQSDLRNRIISLSNI